MLTWALVNTLLTVLAMTFALLNRGSPHRLRFHVCMLALVCWLVPWPQVGGWMPDLLSLDLWRFEQRLITGSANVTQMPLILVDTSAVPLANPVTVLHMPLFLLAALLASGCALYSWSVLQHLLLLRSLKPTARDGSQLLQQSGIESNVPVLLQDRIAGAFSSGVLKPVIWVHSELAASAELPTLLRHELTHIEQHDNAWLLSITLVEKLFWWNPLVAYLGRQTRHLQELSCDERCRAGNADYAVHLAQLMLGNIGISRNTATQAPESLLLSANIFNKPAINIQRLKVLQRSHQMKPRHIVSAIATATLAIVTVGLVTAQPQGNVVFAAETVTASTAAPPSEEGPQVMMGFRLAGDGTDQMLKAEIHNGVESLTFNFVDAALPIVLMPVAQILAGPPPVPAAPAAAPGEPPAVRQQRILIAAPPAPGAPAMAMPVSDKLVLETEEAKTRKVTVKGEGLTLDEAIEAIAKASNCNIFKDGDTIVVDWCGAQQ